MHYRFVLDSMMGKEARWLRILGYDVIYNSYLDDNKIIKIIESSTRILITRDYRLFIKCIKYNLPAIYISKPGITRFLRTFNKLFFLHKNIDFKYSRCPECNGKLLKVWKKRIKSVIPTYIYIRHNIFYQCIECSHIYWLGRHIKNMQKFLGEIDEFEDK